MYPCISPSYPKGLCWKINVQVVKTLQSSCSTRWYYFREHSSETSPNIQLHFYPTSDLTVVSELAVGGTPSSKISDSHCVRQETKLSRSEQRCWLASLTRDECRTRMHVRTHTHAHTLCIVALRGDSESISQAKQ